MIMLIANFDENDYDHDANDFHNDKDYHDEVSAYFIYSSD